MTATITGLFTIIFFGWLYVGVLRPSGSHFAEVVPYANTKYWQLPTGSVIAYSDYDPPQGVAVKPEAIVYLHGGHLADAKPSWSVLCQSLTFVNAKDYEHRR